MHSPTALRFAAASLLLALGVWRLAAPDAYAALAVNDAYLSGHPLTGLVVAAFGAQAVAAGLFALFARFRTGATYLGFGATLLPFLFADAWFTLRIDMFNAWILADVAAQVAMIAVCLSSFTRGADSRAV